MNGQKFAPRFVSSRFCNGHWVHFVQECISWRPVTRLFLTWPWEIIFYFLFLSWVQDWMKKIMFMSKKYKICIFVSVNYQILLIIFLLQKNLIWEGIHLQQEKLPLSVLLSHYCDKKAIGCTGQQNILTSKPLNFFLYKSVWGKQGRETITARKFEVLEKI